MRLRTARAGPPATIEVGGVAVTVEEIKHALIVLSDAKGIMVRQPLSRAEGPLANADYHGLANEQREIDGKAKMHTKSAFMRAWERLPAQAYSRRPAYVPLGHVRSRSGDGAGGILRCADRLSVP